MADKAYNAFYDVQFRKMGLMNQQVQAATATKTAVEAANAAIEGVSTKISGLSFPTSIETKLDSRTEAQLTSLIQALGGIKHEIVKLGQAIVLPPPGSVSISNAATYILVWLGQLRAQVLLDQSCPVTVESSNEKLMTLRDEANTAGRYQQSLGMLEAYPELSRGFIYVFKDFDPKTVTQQTLALELDSRLLALMKLEWRIATEVEDPPPGQVNVAPEEGHMKKGRGKN